MWIKSRRATEDKRPWVKFPPYFPSTCLLWILLLCNSFVLKDNPYAISIKILRWNYWLLSSLQTKQVCKKHSGTKATRPVAHSKIMKVRYFILPWLTLFPLFSSETCFRAGGKIWCHQSQ